MFKKPVIWMTYRCFKFFEHILNIYNIIDLIVILYLYVFLISYENDLKKGGEKDE